MYQFHPPSTSGYTRRTCLQADPPTQLAHADRADTDRSRSNTGDESDDRSTGSADGGRARSPADRDGTPLRRHGRRDFASYEGGAEDLGGAEEGVGGGGGLSPKRAASPKRAKTPQEKDDAREKRNAEKEEAKRKVSGRGTVTGKLGILAFLAHLFPIASSTSKPAIVPPSTFCTSELTPPQLTFDFAITHHPHKRKEEKDKLKAMTPQERASWQEEKEREIQSAKVRTHAPARL